LLDYQLKHLLATHLPRRQLNIRAQRARLEVMLARAGLPRSVDPEGRRRVPGPRHASQYP
jgi:hypothetical protein